MRTTMAVLLGVAATLGWGDRVGASAWTERLSEAREAYMATQPVPLPADAWERWDRVDDAVPEAARYRSVMAEVGAWAEAANARDVLVRKGIWVRPHERDRGALDVLEVFDRMQELGITDVFVETFRGGRLEFPGHPAFPARHGIDLLDLYVREGHRRNMRVHAWLHTLDFGPAWAANHPDTLVMDGYGNHSGQVERGSNRVSPALPEVREALGAVVDGAIARSVDGVMLDYLRYPTRLKGDDIDESPDPRQFFGYAPRQREQIERRHPGMAGDGFRHFLKTGQVVRASDREVLLEQWKTALSEDLEGLIDTLRERVGRRAVLGAAYFPDYYFHQHDARLQESRRWLTRFDLLAPMCYSYNLDQAPGAYGDYTVERALSVVQQAIDAAAPTKAPVVMPVLAPDPPGTPAEAPRHHRGLREQTAWLKGRVVDQAFPAVTGVSYFCLGWIHPELEKRRLAAE